jgi:hypothetical protein
MSVNDQSGLSAQPVSGNTREADSAELSAQAADAQYKQMLADKTLSQLIEEQKRQKHDAELNKDILKLVQKGDLSILDGAGGDSGFPKVAINLVDADKEQQMIAQEGLRNKSSVREVQPGQNAQQQLEERKAWLHQTFPTLKTDAILVHDDAGNTYVDSMGVSLKEIKAAEAIQKEAKVAQMRSDEVAEQIKDTLTGKMSALGSPHANTGQDHDAAPKALMTPNAPARGNSTVVQL